MATYYVDPSASVNGNGLSKTTPFNSWSSVTWGNGNTYLQRAGTTALVFPNLGFTNITLNRYGEGDDPRIVVSTLQMQVSGSGFTIKNFYISGSTNGLLILASGFLGENLEIADTGTGFGIAFGAAGGGTLRDSYVHDTGDDNIEIRLNAGTILLDNVICEWPSKNSISGDNIGGANDGVYNITIRNCKFYKNDPYKQSAILDTTGAIMIEDSIFENLGAGGTLSVQAVGTGSIKRNIFKSTASCVSLARNVNTNSLVNCTFVNNIVVSENGATAISVGTSDATANLYFYNNTFILNNTTGSVFYLNASRTGNYYLKNNIFKGGQYQIYHNTGPTIVESDYNSFDTSEKFVFGGIAKNTFAAWKSDTSKDANSITSAPTFDLNYSPDKGFDGVGKGTKYWGAALRPIDVLNEPFPDEQIDIGAIQTTYHQFHPANLKNA